MYRLTNIILLSTLLLFTLNNCSEKEEDNSSAKEVNKERTHRTASWGKDKQQALAKIKERYVYYGMIDKSLKDDEEIVVAALTAGAPMNIMPKRYHKNKKLILLSLKARPSNFKHVDESLKGDSDILLASLHHEYDSAVKNMKYAPLKLTKDSSFMLEAIKIKPKAKNPSIFSYADKSLKNNKKFVLKAIDIYGKLLCESATDLKDNKEIALYALKHEGETLECLKKEFRYDRALVLTAAKQNGAVILMDIDPQFREDKEIVMTAINQAGPYITAGVGSKLARDKDVKALIAKKLAETKR